MKKFFQKIILWIYIKIHITLINISIALFNTEQDILKADPNNLREGDKKIQRMRHRNNVLEKFFVGQTDEKYVKDYYEILKKADKFIRTSTPHQMAIAADKHGSNYAQKDQYGRRYEHLGFFDGKHKHAGKTLKEVFDLEYEDRRTKDDEYEIMYIFNNKPIEAGLAKIFDVVKKTDKTVVDMEVQGIVKSGSTEIEYVRSPEQHSEFESEDIMRKSKAFEFPIRAVHNNENTVNKIEQLSEYLHVKKIGFEYRVLEFFIPLHFKTTELADDSDIFKEILDVKEIFVKDEYGQLKGFGIIKFMKRLQHKTYEVLKFEGIEMEVVGRV